MKNRLTGLIAAPFTAMNPDLSLNLDLIPKQAHYLAANGVAGAFVCGTTGEGASLTVPERMQVAETWLATAPKSLQVIVHVGHTSVRDSQQLAAHAERYGARAFATIGPTFFRASNIKQLADFCAEVATGAPNLPFYYYHMPSITGADLPMCDFLRLASRSIPNLAGIKFTHENLMDYRRCLEFEGGRYDILFGRDEILLAALAMGAKGAVGSTYNYMPSIYRQVVEAFQKGDLEKARRFQTQAIEIIAIMARNGGLPAGKAMMKLIGLDCGPVRLPLQNLTPEAAEAFAIELKAAGFPVDSSKAAVAANSQPATAV